MESVNDVFRGDKKPPILFRCSQVKTNVRLMFWRLKDSIKSKWVLFSNFKQWKKACLVHLNCKPGEDSYGWWIFNLKGVEAVKIKCLEANKQQTWCCLIYLDFFEERKRRYDCYFTRQDRGWNVNATFLAVREKEIMCGS